MQAAIAVGSQTRDDGVVRALPRRKFVGVALGKIEVGTAVLQGEAAPLGDDGCAETTVVAVDKGDTVAVLVGTAEVDCIAAEMGG